MPIRRSRRLPRSTRRVTRYRASGFARVGRRRPLRSTRLRRRRRPMTRRRLLNVTSQKKYDTMLPVVVDPAGAGTNGPLLVTPSATGQGFNSLFIPSARNFSNQASPYARNSSTIFLRGYRDRVTVTVSGGSSWSWRRTVFFLKGPVLRNFFLDNSQGEQYDTLGASAGGVPARAIGPMVDQIATLIRDYIYRGVQDVDWYDPFNAPLNRDRISVLSDRLITLNPGNESGLTRTYRFWSPVNKNLVYDGFENSESRVSNPYSTDGLPGVGDLYIFDQVRMDTPNSGSTVSPTLRFSPEGVFYWHER